MHVDGRGGHAWSWISDVGGAGAIGAPRGRRRAGRRVLLRVRSVAVAVCAVHSVRVVKRGRGGREVHRGTEPEGGSYTLQRRGRSMDGMPSMRLSDCTGPSPRRIGLAERASLPVNCSLDASNVVRPEEACAREFPRPRWAGASVGASASGAARGVAFSLSSVVCTGSVRQATLQDRTLSLPEPSRAQDGGLDPSNTEAFPRGRGKVAVTWNRRYQTPGCPLSTTWVSRLLG